MSILNPYILIGIILSIVGVFSGGYYKGGQNEVARQQLEIAKLNSEARQKEQALVAAVNQQAKQLVKANNDAKLLQQKRNADIDSGALKLRIPIKTPICPVSVPNNSPASAGVDAGTASAELDAEAAKSLIAIAEEGDAAIRKLNTCISAYNQALETLRSKP